MMWQVAAFIGLLYALMAYVTFTLPPQHRIARKLSKSIKLPPTTHLRDFRIHYLYRNQMKRYGVRSIDIPNRAARARETKR